MSLQIMLWGASETQMNQPSNFSAKVQVWPLKNQETNKTPKPTGLGYFQI